MFARASCHVERNLHFRGFRCGGLASAAQGRALGGKVILFVGNEAARAALRRGAARNKVAFSLAPTL